MKRLIAVLTVFALAVTLAWQYRIELIVKVAPKIRHLVNAVPANIPTQWPQGPATATAAANARPPNVILFLVDDMGFNDVSLYNGGAADGSLQTPPYRQHRPTGRDLHQWLRRQRHLRTIPGQHAHRPLFNPFWL